jgi:maltose-binding protein MalE
MTHWLVVHRPSFVVYRLSLVVCCVWFVVSCSDDGRQTTDDGRLRMWHFWSEPAQDSALRSLVEIYEREHPGVSIELTPLNWADGKSKLQMAFNAGTQPDIIHLGQDWEAEFRDAGVLADTSDANARRLWVVNARALVEWTGGPTTYTLGLCTSDPHNVIKRCLPLIWQGGAPDFYRRLPISADMDERLVQALWSLRNRAVNNAIIEPSRQLDERFLNGEIKQLYTGMWIIDMAAARNITSFRVIPTPSIKNGDVLAITARSAANTNAQRFIAWLAAAPQARAFCDAVSDAGFAADTAGGAGETAGLSPRLTGFAQTVALSSFLPSTPVMLSVEPIIEQLIERSYHAPSQEAIRKMVADAKRKVEDVER